MSINRPTALGVCLILVLASFIHAHTPPVRFAPLRRASARPNILWITAEDMSPDMGAYGDSYARTPNLDRFAREGATFTRAFAVAPVCAPSRSGIITGMYPTSTGAMHMRSLAVPPAHVRLFPEYLRAAGYYTTNNNKADYNFDTQNRAPVTAWDEHSNAAHWRNRPDKAQPFFSVFNLMTTHESRIRASSEEFAKLTKDLAPAERHDPRRAVLPPYYPDTPIVRDDWARYHDLVTAMDKQFAALLAQLDEDGLSDNTIVFFYGDHGRGLPRAKRWLYDSGLRVPLVVRWRGVIEPGTIREDLVSLIDLAPTVLALAGVEVPPHMQGQVFLGERQARPRLYIFAHRDRMDEAADRIRAVRDRRYKYLRNFHPERPYAQYIHYAEQMPTMQEWRSLNKADSSELAESVGSRGVSTPAQRFFFSAAKPLEELYDTERDPHEINNLATQPQHRATLARMRAELRRWITRTGDLGALPEAELKRRMRPGGRHVQTAAPTIDAPEKEFTGSTSVSLACPTAGASIAYTFDAGDAPRWLLYTRPLTINRSTTLRVKACRLGYRDSPEAVARFIERPRR